MSRAPAKKSPTKQDLLAHLRRMKTLLSSGEHTEEWRLIKALEYHIIGALEPNTWLDLEMQRNATARTGGGDMSAPGGRYAPASAPHEGDSRLR
jgi:hypothetical protein